MENYVVDKRLGGGAFGEWSQRKIFLVQDPNPANHSSIRRELIFVFWFSSYLLPVNFEAKTRFFITDLIEIWYRKRTQYETVRLTTVTDYQPRARGCDYQPGACGWQPYVIGTIIIASCQNAE